MNEGDEYSNPLALLLCGVGDPRNVLLTIASLPDVYTQQVNFVLNDICPCTLARTILLLYMLYKGIFFVSKRNICLQIEFLCLPLGYYHVILAINVIVLDQVGGLGNFHYTPPSIAYSLDS